MIPLHHLRYHTHQLYPRLDLMDGTVVDFGGIYCLRTTQFEGMLSNSSEVDITQDLVGVSYQPFISAVEDWSVNATAEVRYPRIIHTTYTKKLYNLSQSALSIISFSFNFYILPLMLDTNDYPLKDVGNWVGYTVVEKRVKSLMLLLWLWVWLLHQFRILIPSWVRLKLILRFVYTI